MIYKFVGSALIVLSCGGFGFNAAAAHKKEVRLLKDTISSIQYMKCELEFRCMPLPELCRKTADASSGGIRSFYQKLSQVLDSQICPDTESCCAYVLSQQKNFPSSVRETIMTMSATLGSFDLRGQLEGLEHAIRHGEAMLDKLTFEQDNRLRSYQTLGLCAGAALAILLV